VAFWQKVDYNHTIMSFENEDEQAIGQEIDQSFNETVGTTLEGRIQMAAYAIGNHVYTLDQLERIKRKSHENVPSAKEGTSIFSPLFIASAHLVKKSSIPPEKEIFTPIEKAKMARNAALEGTQATYDLTKRQARRALRLAERTFSLFRIPQSDDE
jgi:hypothetical protein